MKVTRLASVLILLVSVIMGPVRAASSPEVVKIGITIPLSGAAATTGLEIKYGYDLAAEIINGEFPELEALGLPFAAKRGIPNLGGAKLELIYTDHQSSPERALGEVDRLVTRENVAVIAGAFQSAVTATASQAAERLRVPFVTPESTAPSLTQRGFKWFFRLTLDDDGICERLFRFLADVKDKRGAKIRNVALVNENTLWGADAAKAMRKYAAQYGLNVVEDVLYPSGTAEVTSIAARIKASKPDVILHSSYVSDAILYVTTYQELDVVPTGAILANGTGFVDPAFIGALGKSAEFVMSRENWAKDLGGKNELIKTVNEMFEKRYRMSMSGNSSRPFVSLFVIADALNRAGTVDRTAVRDALRTTDFPEKSLIVPWRGVKFDEKGDNIYSDIIVVQCINGVYKTVWPFRLASTDLVWPFPAWKGR